MESMSIPHLIKKVASGEKTHKDLTRAEARWVMASALAGRLSDLQLGALLAALRLKGEKVDELAGFLEAVAATVQPVPSPAGGRPLVAHCGATSGKAHAFLSSLGGAMLAAAAGVPVLICGRTGEEAKSPVTEVAVARALGARTDLAPEAIAERLERVGVAVCEQRLLHPGLTRLSLLRIPLGMRTVAQSVEKFVFPVRPTAVLAGAFHLNYLRRLAEAAAGLYDFLLLLLQERDGGVDPMPAGLVRGFQVHGGQVADWVMTPEAASIARFEKPNFPPLDPAETARLTRDLLAGRGEPPLEAMLLYHAGLVIHLGRPELSLPEAVNLARSLQREGGGLAVLERFTQEGE